MINALFRSIPVILSAVAILGVALSLRSHAAESVPVSEISKKTHIHGIAVDPRDPSRIYLATHHGFFVVGQDGMATRLSGTRDDFMGFTPHPTDPSLLYASGHLAGGGNLGIITSSDGGRSWRQIAKGVRGPVDFHQMDMSKADPRTIYGVYGGLQTSRDGGRQWELVGRAPDGLIDLAASAKDVNTLYAATRTGLLISKDGGKSWQAAHLLRWPATMVEAGSDGETYAFVVGTGLLRTTEPSLNWSLLSNGFGDSYVLHLAIDPTNTSTLYAVTDQGGVLASKDGGRTWTSLGGQ